MRKTNLVYLMLLTTWQIFGPMLWAQAKLDTSIIVREAALNELKKKTGSKIEVIWDDQHAVPRVVFSKLTATGYLYTFRDATDAAIVFLDENKNLFNISKPREELKLTHEQQDELGMRHLKFQQYENGLRVRGCELLVHFEKNGSIQSVNGNWMPSFDLPAIASISKQEARAIALTRAGGQCEVNATELIFYPLEAKILLAWDAKMSDPERPKMEAIIDAHDGRVLYFDDGLRFHQLSSDKSNHRQTRQKSNRIKSGIETSTFTINQSGGSSDKKYDDQSVTTNTANGSNAGVAMSLPAAQKYIITDLGSLGEGRTIARSLAENP